MQKKKKKINKIHIVKGAVEGDSWGGNIKN